MIKNTMPPQAYTRDTLVKAIDWVSNQPENLRVQAKTADALVALYLQAKRRSNDWSLKDTDHPVSGEAFKEDLKTLARDLEQFAVPPTPTAAPATPPQQRAQPPELPVYSYAPPTPPTPPQAAPPQAPPPVSHHQSVGYQWTVDALSLKRAQALKERLNLSSEGEALRMMIALGFERAQSL